MAQAGTVLGGRYILDDQIGYGGYGEVWRATDTVLTRPVAVKLLHPRYSQRSEAVARFRAEARHAGGLSHENIAQVFDYGQPADGQPPYLVMELVDGPSLETVLTGGPLDDSRTMDIVAQAAAGLQAAHTAGMIHRDIKPGNLLLAPGGIVKVTDFGIAHTIGSAPLTATGELIGTPGYLAPERAMGERATTASDLYSLGMLAYECLAGAPPFRGTPLEVALAHRDRPLPPLPGSVPAGLAALILALTAKDPAARPGSAAEVARHAAALAGRPGPARLPTVPVRAPPVPAQPSVPAQSPGPEAPPAAGPHWADDQPTLHQPQPGRAWPRRRSGALAATLATAALVGGIFLAGQAGPMPTPPAVAGPSATHRPSDPRVRLVDVRRGALIGQPVTAAAQLLRRHGLKVRVRWRLSAAVPPGTVLAVQPAGRRPAGSVITLIGAVPPPPSPAPGGHGHGHGHGPGHGRDGGPGKGDGGPGKGDGGQGNGDGGGNGGGDSGDGGDSQA